ncbi:MAG: hypothetical protein AMXMBFR84_29370 [Candidatus Hydrogenedentota bacterium]
MDWINNEAGLVMLSTIISGLWAFFKSQEWLRLAKEHKGEKALLALEAGVHHAYEEYVRAIKAARTDGKLTPEERRRARDLAVHAAVEFGRNEGVDVMTELGVSYIDAWLKRLLQQIKTH